MDRLQNVLQPYLAKLEISYGVAQIKRRGRILPVRRRTTTDGPWHLGWKKKVVDTTGGEWRLGRMIEGEEEAGVP